MKKITAFLFLLLCINIFACSVPVFRYALERWRPDPYVIQLNYNTSHTNKLSEILETLRTFDYDYSFIIEKIKNSEKSPQINLLYPKPSGLKTNVWKGQMTVNNIKKISDSPARREIARRILGGDSAVFLLLEGENEKNNNKVAATLLKNITIIEEDIKLPHEYTDIPEEDLQIYDTNIVFKLSLLRLSKTNSDDMILINMLTRILPDSIPNDSYPIVYPIFGRGRMLTAMFAKDVTARNLQGLCEYIAGECSCEIKGQNPGIDLLFSVDWDSLIEPGINLDAMLPPLAGFSEFTPAKSDTNFSAVKIVKSKNKLKLWKNVIIVLGIITLGGAIIKIVKK
ncbi:hypothetical protein KAH27_06995 [bacterium]|nr:hypothetical protein [bacterium]